MVMCGGQQLVLIFFLMAIMVTGYTQTAAGLGHPIIPGAGRHFIMEDGFMIPFTDGFGYLIITGLPPGWYGAKVPVITGGHHWDRAFP